MSVKIVESQINQTNIDNSIWLWFLRICILILIIALIFCGYLALTLSWYCWLVEFVIIPALGFAIKAYSDQSKVSVDFISALNQTQIISNSQDKIKREIILEELSDKQKGG